MWENIKTVTYKGRKIWKKQMKSYYLKRKIKTIGKHINNVLKEELDNQVVSQNLRQFRMKEQQCW